MALALTGPFTLIVRGHLLSIFLDCLFLFGYDHGSYSPASPFDSDYEGPPLSHIEGLFVSPCEWQQPRQPFSLLLRGAGSSKYEGPPLSHLLGLPAYLCS